MFCLQAFAFNEKTEALGEHGRRGAPVATTHEPTGSARQRGHGGQLSRPPFSVLFLERRAGRALYQY